MGKIDYQAIYNENKDGWKKLTDAPQRYEALLAGHYSDSNHFYYKYDNHRVFLDVSKQFK